MVSLKQIQELGDKFAKLKKERTDLENELEKHGISVETDTATIYVRTLFDGEDHLSGLFVSEFCNSVNPSVRFERLPISKLIVDDEPLMLISDDTEIDHESRRKLVSRKRVDAPTFPVIIFPDDYFILRKGENLGYPKICDTLNQFAECPVMPFREQDIHRQLPVTELYINCIAEIVWLSGLQKKLKIFLQMLCDEWETTGREWGFYDCKSDKGIPALTQLSVNCYLLELCKLCALIEKEIHKARALLKKFYGFENDIHAEYDRHIYRIVTHKNTEEKSDFAIKLDLMYRSLDQNLVQLCREAERETELNELEYSLADVIRETQRLIDVSAEIAFIGTFSSGKTTLINTLLGHDHKFRTSGAHNTAVLMEIYAAQGMKEYYEVVYKKELRWDIIRPDSFTSNNIVNTFECSAKVTAVRQNVKGGWVISYKSVKGHETREINIGSGHKLAVGEGDVVKPGASFVVPDTDKDTFRLCSKRELDYIKKLISGDRISRACFLCADCEKSGLKEIRQIIEKLVPVYQNFKMDSSQPSISMNDLKNIFGSQSSSLKRTTFVCELSGFKGQRYELDEEGWQKFMGEGDFSNDPFCENPECYMPAEKIKVYLSSVFLKYCSITDTPGFGSITDEHDAITERYLRDSAGKLVVMITINDHTFDRKLDDLLNNISSIFKTFRKNEMKDVSFVLNCFTNISPMKQCEKTVKNVYDHIKQLGFSEENIYVDNLRQVLDNNTEQREFIPSYPSYYLFRKDCLAKFLHISIKSKYARIYLKWNEFFERNWEWLRERININKENLNRSEERESELMSMIGQAGKVQFVSAEDYVEKIKEDFDSIYDGFEGAFRGNRKGIWTHHRKKAVMEVLNDVYKPTIDLWEKDGGLAIQMQDAFDQLEGYAGTVTEMNRTYVRPPERCLVVATFGKTKDILITADKETNIFNQNKKTNYHMSKLKKLMKEDKEASCSNVRAYHKEYKEMFDKRKEFLLSQMRAELRSLGDADLIKDSIRKFEVMYDSLSAFKRQHFDVIVFDI